LSIPAISTGAETEILIRQSVQSRLRRAYSNKRLFEKVGTILDAVKRRKGIVTVLFTDDREIRKLNRRYRGMRKATDVLSFPPGDGGRYLGDIVISVETAARQAKEHEIPFAEEILRLLVHGVLHLVGHEHENVSARKARRMAREEERIHRLIGVRAGLELDR
jgi:probable rRNA maturation factor